MLNRKLLVAVKIINNSDGNCNWAFSNGFHDGIRVWIDKTVILHLSSVEFLVEDASTLLL